MPGVNFTKVKMVNINSSAFYKQNLCRVQKAFQNFKIVGILEDYSLADPERYPVEH